MSKRQNQIRHESETISSSVKLVTFLTKVFFDTIAKPLSRQFNWPQSQLIINNLTSMTILKNAGTKHTNKLDKRFYNEKIKGYFAEEAQN